VARLATKNALQGAEFLAGIPGTVGGALAMNAGCHGGETWGIVAEVESVDRQGVRRRRTARDYAIGYRQVALKDEGGRMKAEGGTHPSSFIPPPCSEWFVAAWFRLRPGDGEASRRLVREWMTRRAATQPLREPNAGSVFRNPPNDHAGRLIEAAGLKGRRLGGARVSEKHANFIVNGGNATAADIEALIGLVRAEVKRQFGVELVSEVKILGDKA
jgi:UDP-N-acetylmuramate dehydrogenase